MPLNSTLGGSGRHRGDALVQSTLLVAATVRGRVEGIPGSLELPVPRTGAGDLTLVSPGQQVVIDELRSEISLSMPVSRIGMVLAIPSSCQAPISGRVAHRPVFRPAGSDVGDRQCDSTFASDVAEIVTDEIDFKDSFAPIVLGTDAPFRSPLNFGIGARDRVVAVWPLCCDVAGATSVMKVMGPIAKTAIAAATPTDKR